MELNFAQQLCILGVDFMIRLDIRSLIPSSGNPNFIQYSIFVLSILTLVLGIVGNAIVIIVTGFVMKTHKSRIWFLNLAISDMMFLLILPFYTVSVLGGNWLYGEHVCKLSNFLSIVNMYVSVFLITALTIDRFLSVMAPIWHHKFYSPRACYCTCASIWTVTFALSTPAIIFSQLSEFEGVTVCSLYESDINLFAFFKGQEFNSTARLALAKPNVTVEQLIEKMHKFCIVENSDNFDNEGKAIYDITLTAVYHFILPFSVISYFIPLCVILCANVAIACKVRTSGTIRSSKLYSIVTAAIMAFIITWTPFVISELIKLVYLHSMNFTLLAKITLVTPLLVSIANLNCCLNPIIYVFIGREAKSACRNFLHRLRHRNASFSSSAPVVCR